MKDEFTSLTNRVSPGSSAASGRTSMPVGLQVGWKGELGDVEWCRMWITGRDAVLKVAMIVLMLEIASGVLDVFPWYGRAVNPKKRTI